MKRALEAALAAAVLALGGYVLRQALSRRAAARTAGPAAAPGADGGAVPDPAERGVSSLPAIRLSRPPRARSRFAEPRLAPPPP